ncbi:MAG: DUF4340 domain-containing protein [Candidatus Binatia bacterium]|nr:DUF4340 domain-containing protein [Candidatus Binatia bacterium]
MGPRFTLVSATLLALVILVYYLDRTPPPPPRRVGLPIASTPQPPAPSGTPLVIHPADAVHRLVLSLDGSTRATERTDLGWAGTDRSELIEEFVRDLTRLGPLETIQVTPERLAEFGLAPPRGRVELYIEGRSTPVVFEVGNLNPPGTAVYLRVPGEDRVLLVGSLIHWELQRNIRILSSLASPSPSPTPTTAPSA